jgi:hypothetical protein
VVRRRRLRFATRISAAAASRTKGPIQSSAVVALNGRLVEHEIAVTLHQKPHDLLVALAGRDLLAHLLAKVARQLGVGIGERLVLADQATQLFLELPDALFVLCISLQRKEEAARQKSKASFPQLFGERQDLLLEHGRRDGPDLLEADHAFGVDEVGLGHAVDAVVDADASVGVDDRELVGVAELGKPALGFLAPVPCSSGRGSASASASRARPAADARRGRSRTRTPRR